MKPKAKPCIKLYKKRRREKIKNIELSIELSIETLKKLDGIINKFISEVLPKTIDCIANVIEAIKNDKIEVNSDEHKRT